MVIEVLVPPLGQTVDTVTLVTWYHDEGDEAVSYTHLTLPTILLV